MKRIFSPLRLLTATMFFFVCSAAFAQSETYYESDEQKSESSDKGQLTASFETNTIIYHNDKRTGANAPESNFGSNNYLKLDYYRGKFSMGAQMEGYFPVVQGYPNELKGMNLSNYYLSWSDKDFTVTAGTFYDQFGSGLLFRSWDDRMLGINNAIAGARINYNYRNILSLKALWGLPRFGMQISDTQVRGADLSFSISNLAKISCMNLALEASVLNRYEKISMSLEDEGGSPHSIGYSARLKLDSYGFFFNGEYVDGGNKWYDFPNGENYYVKKKANAQLIECGYNGHGLGLNMTLRRLEWMKTDIVSGNASTANMINYIPAMCTQHTYMLANLHPYSTQTGLLTPGFVNSGEIGGQIDVFYNFRRGTKLGGKRGMKMHANFSTYYTIAEEGTFKSGNMLLRDFSFDVEKQFTKKFKMILLYAYQEYSPTYGANKATNLANVFVADLLYKYTPKFSTRLELQYLTTFENDRDWMAALLEANFAPKWSVFVSDMFNHGSSKIHYFNAGVSYVHSRTRIALSYGRNRKGYICSGGVCRQIDAYTGANLVFTTSF